MKTIVIYKLCFPNGKYYIGQTVNLIQRMYSHTKSKYPIGRAIRKYGCENIQITILHQTTSRQKANKLEIQEIAEHSCMYPNGYNLTSGGKVAFVVCAETKRKCGIVNKGRNPSQETRKKISLAGKGNKRALGYKHTREFKISLAARNKGNKYALGLKHTAETRKRMSESTKVTWAKKKGVA